MANERLYSDECSEYFLDADRGLLELRWLPKPMSEQQFRDGISRLAEFLERKTAPNCIVDNTQIQHRPAEDFEPWRQANIIPRYNAAGLKKLAFLYPPAMSQTVENGVAPSVEGKSTYETGYFNTRERMERWVDAKP